MHVEVFIQVGIAAAWRPLNPYFRQVRARYRPLITGLRLDGPRRKKGLPSLKYAMAAARGRYVLMGFNGWPLGTIGPWGAKVEDRIHEKIYGGGAVLECILAIRIGGISRNLLCCESAYLN